MDLRRIVSTHPATGHRQLQKQPPLIFHMVSCLFSYSSLLRKAVLHDRFENPIRGDIVMTMSPLPHPGHIFLRFKISRSFPMDQ